MFEISKGTKLNKFVHGGQLYWAFPFSKGSLLCLNLSLYRRINILVHTLSRNLVWFGWRYDTQHNDIQHNDTQHNAIQHDDTQYNVIQHNETDHSHTHNDTKCWILSYWLPFVLYRVFHCYADRRYAECHSVEYPGTGLTIPLILFNMLCVL
jgi:hypothetical protein